jgi:hypothetical protein
MQIFLPIALARASFRNIDRDNRMA